MFTLVTTYSALGAARRVLAVGFFRKLGHAVLTVDSTCPLCFNPLFQVAPHGAARVDNIPQKTTWPRNIYVHMFWGIVCSDACVRMGVTATATVGLTANQPLYFIQNQHYFYGL